MPDGYYIRGVAYTHKNEWDKALTDFNTALVLNSNDFNALVARALLRATCPDAKSRDAKKALEDAMKAGMQTKWQFPGCFDVVAAAYAEAGQFDAAVKWEKRAIADPVFPSVAIDQARERLKLYEQSKPFRMPEKK